MATGETGDRFWSSYDVNAPPPLTSPSHVRFVVIADTHSTTPDVPDGDILLHAGDLTDIGGTEALEEQLRWLRTLPHKKKVIIAGNHDFALDNATGWYDDHGVKIHAKYSQKAADCARALAAVRSKDGGVHYLDHEGIEIVVDREGVRERKWNVWGSPWSPYFGGWAFNYQRGDEAKKLFQSIPSDVDILLTHSPPHELGALDKLTDGETSVGCEELQRKLESAEIRPRLHCFGHIHESRGIVRQTWSDAADEQSTILANAAIVEFDLAAHRAANEVFAYKVRNQPLIVDLDSRIPRRAAQSSKP